MKRSPNKNAKPYDIAYQYFLDIDYKVKSNTPQLTSWETQLTESKTKLSSTLSEKELTTLKALVTKNTKATEALQKAFLKSEADFIAKCDTPFRTNAAFQAEKEKIEPLVTQTNELLIQHKKSLETLLNAYEGLSKEVMALEDALAEQFIPEHVNALTKQNELFRKKLEKFQEVLNNAHEVSEKTQTLFLPLQKSHQQTSTLMQEIENQLNLPKVSELSLG